MNATTNDESLRDVATAAGSFRDRVAAAEVGRRLDVPTSTVTRRDERHETILDWTARDFLRLARTDEQLGQAVRSYLDGHLSAPGSAAAIAHDLEDDLDASAVLHRITARALSDGVVNGHEPSAIRNALLDRIAVSERMLRNLDAALAQQAAAGRGPR